LVQQVNNTIGNSRLPRFAHWMVHHHRRACLQAPDDPKDIVYEWLFTIARIAS
jgi:hypothetical protein